jgi:molybdopterin synthase catalytic subunit
MKIRVQREDFDLNAELDVLRRERPTVGAIVAFAGVVRGSDTASSLTLEHYPGMTEREIGRHVRDANARWPLLGVTVIHRIGELRPGDNIVLVAVAAEHRRAAFEAAEFLMDYLKARAPFWKREAREGKSEWIDSRDSDEAALRRWRED